MINTKLFKVPDVRKFAKALVSTALAAVLLLGGAGSTLTVQWVKF